MVEMAPDHWNPVDAQDIMRIHDYEDREGGFFCWETHGESTKAIKQIWELFRLDEIIQTDWEQQTHIFKNFEEWQQYCETTDGP
jgi:hypothetical protein